MSFKHVDMESALRRLADRRIEEAMREGKFDNLAGAGKPLDLEPMPAEANARMTWWMLRILKGADFTPDEIRLRRQIEGLKAELATATSPQRVGVLVKTVNGLVTQLNTLGTNAINIAVSPVSLERELERLRERSGAAAEARAADGSRGEHAAPAEAAVPFARVASPPPPAGPDAPPRRCANRQCRNGNPDAARFCRRCGKVLADTGR